MMKDLKQKKLRIEITICIEKDEDAYYAYAPSFPGFHIGGDTKEEAIQNAKDSIIAYILSLIKHNKPLPLTTFISYLIFLH